MPTKDHSRMTCYGRRLAVVSLLVAVAHSGCADDPLSDNFNAHAEETVPAVQSRATTVRPASAAVSRPPQMANSKSASLDPSVRYVIIHADDAGMCEAMNRGTIEALEAGVVTSASIMVPCPAFEEFADWASRHPQFDYGIHLTLNAEFASYRWGPVLPADEVPSLVDSSGYLWRTEQQTAANARADDVERELRAQIDRALEHNVPLTHLDSHMGTLFMRPDLVDVYVQLGADYDLPVLFTRDDGFLRQLRVGDQVVGLLDDLADSLESRGFPVLDQVQMHYQWDSVESKKRAYLNLIRQCRPGVTEIIVHCGRDDAEFRSITGSYLLRDRDRQVFTDPSVVSQITKSGVQLISWRELNELSANANDNVK